MYAYDNLGRRLELLGSDSNLVIVSQFLPGVLQSLLILSFLEFGLHS